MATILTSTPSRLKGALQGLQGKITKLEAQEARQRTLATLKKTEEGELTTLKALETNFAPVLKDLHAINWPVLGRTVNIGSVESDLKNIVAELASGISIHETVLAAFESGGEPSEELLVKAETAQGLAARLAPRIEELTATAERLARGAE
jgi:prefoldin subunit 5